MVVARLVAVVLVAVSLSAAPTSKPAPSPLSGRWRLVAEGNRMLPASFNIIWAFDDSRCNTFFSNKLATQSTYRLTRDGDRNLIHLTYSDSQGPERIGMWEIRGNQLRIQLDVGTPYSTTNPYYATTRPRPASRSATAPTTVGAVNVLTFHRVVPRD